MKDAEDLDGRLIEFISASLPASIEKRVERRTEKLRVSLLPYLNSYLSPDTAGSQALVLALLVARLEIPLAAQVHAGQRVVRTSVERDVGEAWVSRPLILKHVRDQVDADLMNLPVFLEEQRATGESNVARIVHRFMRGERSTLPPAGVRVAGDALIGSVVSLSPRETALRLRELQAWGVDIALTEATLALTPAQRVAQMEHTLLLFAGALASEKLRGE